MALCRGNGAAATMPLVLTVRVTLAVLPPGTTDAGEKAQAAPAGRLVHENETAVLNEPYCGVTAMLKVPELPRFTLRLAGVIAGWKSVTAKLRALELAPEVGFTT